MYSGADEPTPQEPHGAQTARIPSILKHIQKHKKNPVHLLVQIPTRLNCTLTRRRNMTTKMIHVTTTPAEERRQVLDERSVLTRDPTVDGQHHSSTVSSLYLRITEKNKRNQNSSGRMPEILLRTYQRQWHMSRS